MKSKQKLPYVFFTDTARLKAEKADSQRILHRLNGLLHLWERITKFPITSISELATMVDNPREYFTTLIKADNAHAAEKARQIFGERANVDELIEKIYLPNEFGDIERIITDYSNVKWSRFHIINGTIELSEEWHSGQINKSYFVIENEAQRERLETLNALCKSFEDIEVLFRKEIEAAGKKPANYWSTLARKSFLNTLPIGVKLVSTGEVVTDRDGYSEHVMKVIPDPHFVISGFQIAKPQIKQAKEYEGDDYRIAFVKHIDGATVPVLVREGDPIPVDPERVFPSRLLPNIFKLINGRPVDTGKPGKTYEPAPLLKQD